MLQLVLGRASSGKTETIYNLASKENVDNTIIIVPEQYTFETERNLLKRDLSGIPVLSFSRLIETTKNIYGGFVGDTLSKFDKVIVMLRALNNVKDSLTIYKNYYDSLEFANKLISLSNEFKENAVTIDELNEKVEDIKLSSTKAKIRDIITILLEYEAIVAAEFLDPADDLMRLYDVINQKHFFKGKNLYFDGFKNFSNAQLKIVKCALRDADKVVISFCVDTDYQNKPNGNIFNNIYQIIDRIKVYAEDVSCVIAEPILLNKNYYGNKELEFLEKNILSGSNAIYEGKVSNIGFLHSKSPMEMIDNVMLLIHRLARNKGYKYNDFLIVARDINKYDRHINSISDKYDIPVYFDKRRSLKYSPVSRFVLSALNAALTFKSESIFEYLKSGLFILPEDDIEKISEYVFTWNIDGSDWLDEWSGSVKGLNEYKNDEDKEKCAQKLAHINELREKIIAPLNKLKYALSDDAVKNCEVIYDFMKASNVNEKLSYYITTLEEAGDYKEADYSRASYEPFMEILSSLHKCFKNYNVKVKKFVELLSHSINNKSVGSIPQMIDEVSCGSADRIRPARPKVAFVIGLNQYEFPAGISDGDLLINSDRQALIDLKIDIVDKLDTYLYNENFLVYSTACCASEKVYFCSCSGKSESMPANVISTIKGSFKEVRNINFSNSEHKIETVKNSFSVLAFLKQGSSCKYAPLKMYFDNTEYREKLEYLQKTLEISDAKLSKAFVSNYLDKDLNMSASRVDVFYKCKFRYFCNYILYLRKQKPAEIDVANRGTIVHFVLEQSIKNHGKSLATMSENELFDLVDLYLNQYLDLVDATILLNDERFKFIFSKIGVLTKKVMLRISEEFKASAFEPVYCECDINNDIPKLEIQGKNKIFIEGSIDRVDIYNDGKNNYVRVVDYKSSNMKININNILYGLNLQMLIYLYAFVKNDEKYKAKPAGVFYLPVNGGFNKENPNMKMSGIIPEEAFLYQALDSTASFIPAAPKDGKRMDNPQISTEDFKILFNHVEHMIKEMERSVLGGEFEVSPMGKERGACQYCDFKTICRLEDDNKVRKISKTLNTQDALEFMRGTSYGI